MELQTGESERGIVIRSEGASIHHPRRTRKTAEAEERERERETDRRTDGRRRRGKWKIGRFPLLDGAGGGAKTACQPVVVVD